EPPPKPHSPLISLRFLDASHAHPIGLNVRRRLSRLSNHPSRCRSDLMPQSAAPSASPGSGEAVHPERTSVLPPIHLMKWIEAHKADFKPPVGNKYLYDGEDFFIMIIGGPNARNDFHQTNSEEFFIQLKGDIVVTGREDGKLRHVPIREGETFFSPGNVPHSPQRPPGT